MSRPKYLVLQETVHAFLVTDGRTPFFVPKAGLDAKTIGQIQRFAADASAEPSVRQVAPSRWTPPQA